MTHHTVAISAHYADLGVNIAGFSWPDFSPDGRYLIFRSVTNADNPAARGSHVLVWNVYKQRSVFTAANGSTPVGWSDACVTGVNNGTNFSPVISDPSRSHSYRVLFTVARDGVCNLVLRDLQGNDIPIRSEINVQQILEPTINSTGDFIGWDVASQPQLVYACRVNRCTNVNQAPGPFRHLQYSMARPPISRDHGSPVLSAASRVMRLGSQHAVESLRSQTGDPVCRAGRRCGCRKPVPPGRMLR